MRSGLRRPALLRGGPTSGILLVSAIVSLVVLLTVPAGAVTAHPATVTQTGHLSPLQSIGDARRALSAGTGPAAASEPLRSPNVRPSFSPPTAPGSPWHQTDLPNAPSARATPAMAYDPLSHDVVYFGGGWNLGAAGNDTWTFANGAWTNISAGLSRAPSAREGAVMAYDAADGYLVLFGGYAQPSRNSSLSFTLNDTWKFQSGTWTNITAQSVVAPPSRFVPAMAYDYTDGYVVLFGGNLLSGVPLNDTWKFHAGNWTNLSSTAGSAPAGRDFASMTDDPSDGYVLLFGGWNSRSSTIYNDSWSFAAGTWSKITTSSAPQPLRGAMLAYDPATRYVLLFGGTTYAAPGWPFALVGDTWTYASGTWTNQTALIASSPPARFSGGIANLSTGGAVVMADGCLGQGCAQSVDLSDTWIYNASGSSGLPWQEVGQTVQPSARATGGMAYDPNGPYALYFGGGWDLGTSLNDTWTWANGNWTNLTSTLTRAPSPREDTRLVYDAADGYIVLFGGYGNGGRSFGYQSFTLNDTWKFQHGAWTNITANSSRAPPGLFDFAMTYDYQDGYVLLFGGQFLNGGPSNETWAFHAGVWTQLVGRSPPGRDFTSLVDDPGAGYVLLFGGWNASIATLYNDTWSFSHGAWTLLSPANSPPPLRGGPVAYEALGQYVLLYGGVTYSYPSWPFGLRSDTWAYVNSSWLNLSPFITAEPPGRFAASMTNLSTTGTIIMADGCLGQGCFQSIDLADTWLYNWTNPNGTFGLAGLPKGLHQPTQFSVVAVGGTFRYHYAYSGLPPGCLTADTSQLSCSPSSGGTYDISATVTDSAGRSVTLALNVTFGAQPLVLSFGESRAVLDAGQTVTFIATASGGTGGPWTYAYAGLPPGCTSVNSASFSCSPALAGTYSIHASATDSQGGVVHSSVVLTVNAPVAVALGVSADTIDLTQSVVLQAMPSGGSQSYNYVWSGLPPGCGVAITEVLACTPTSSGTSTVSVTATDSLAQVASSNSRTITVNAMPALEFTASAGGPSASFTVQFDAKIFGGTGPFTVSWVFGDGATGSGLSPSHTYAQAGTYLVQSWLNDSRGLGDTTTLAVPVTAPMPLSPGPNLSSSWLPGGVTGFLLGLSIGLVVLAVVGAWALRRSRSIADGERLVGALEVGADADTETRPDP